MSETPSQTLSADARQVCEFAASLPLDVLHRATVWVTGAGGFLGTHLVRAFLALDEAYHLRMSVVGVGRDAARMRRRWQELGVRGRPGQLTVGVADLSRPLTRTGPRPDVIVHAASQASPRFYGTDPVGTLLPNTVGTAELLARAVGTNARAFLFLSSSEVYGSVADPLREAETGAVDPVHVRNCYAESKRMGESMCVSWFHQYGVRTHIARLFHTYGPGLALDDGRVFADFVRDVVERRDIRLRGDGTAVRSFCYVTDAVNGMLAVLCRGEPGAAYNVGNPDAAISMRGLADLLATLIPDRHVGVSTDTIADSTGYLASTTSKSVPDVSRLRALGWHPRFSLAEGFRRTILSYLDDPIKPMAIVRPCPSRQRTLGRAMTVARMRELRDEYFSGRRDKWSYVAETFRHHEQLFEYARWLPETGLADIRIEHGRVLVTVRASGLRFVLPEGDARSAPLDVLNFGAYETAELSTLVSLLEAPAVVVDVGANIGWYSMHLAYAFPEATIHAVEPGERTAAVLEENIAENGIRNVEVHRVALADKPGRALLHIPADLAVNASLRPVSPDRTTQLQPCAVKTLDELSVTLDGRIDCVKCDVEGGELDVFRGGARVLGEDRPVVFTEMLRKWSAAYGHHPNDVIALFSSMSYDCYAFDHQRLRRCTHVTEETTATNYVFLHRERHRAHIAAVA